MKKLFGSSIASLFCVCLLFSTLNAHVSWDDFAILEGKNSTFWKKVAKEDEKELLFYENIYKKNFPLLKQASSPEVKIPRVIHWIWLGPKPFPSEAVAYIDSWKRCHPGWTLKFWTDRADRPCPVEGMEKYLIQETNFSQLGSFLSKTTNPAEQSDLLRYEILFREGGLYVDHDAECFQSFESLHKTFDFFACLEPPHRNAEITGRIFPSNGIIGVIAGHPILLSTIQHVQKRWEKVEEKYPGTDAKSNFARVITRTFHSFTLATREHINKQNRTDIVFPAAFFSPDRIFNATEREALKKQCLSYASHHFAGSWLERPAVNLFEKKLRHLRKAQRKNEKKINVFTALLWVNVSLSLGMLFALKKR